MSEELQRYLSDFLQRNIPLCTAMGVEVLVAGPDRVALRAPLAPNINHRDTVFGGSAASLATLSAWALLHLRMLDVDADAHLVIQHCRMHYLRPIAGDFVATCRYDDEAAWDKACRLLARRGKARATLHSEVHWEGTEAARFEGEFVIIRRSDRAARSQ